MKKKERNIPKEKKKSTVLRLLIIEDDSHDAERVIGVLGKGGYMCRWDRVETRADFISRLDTEEYDLILADYNKPTFDGISAIQICLEHNQDVPLIIVSGAPGEEKAIECLKAGATDYVLKNHLPRLIPVVQRALQEKEEHRRRKLAEENLRENERQYRSLYQEFQGILDAIPDSLILIAPDLKVVWSNEGLAALLNKKNFDLIGQYCYQIWHSRSEPCKVCPVQRSFRSKKPESEEVPTPDGRIWDVRGVPLIGDQGEVKGVIEVARNITEKKRADEALRSSEEKYRTLVEGSTDAIVMLNKERRIVSCNQAFFDLFRYTENEIEGKLARLIYPSEESFNAFETLVYPAINMKGFFRTEWDFIRKDGTISPCETVTSAIKNPDGSANSFVTIIRDITERKRAEEKLRESEKQYRTLFEESQDAIYISSREGEFIDVNRATFKLFGFTREELIGKLHIQGLYFQPSEREKFQQEIEQKGAVRDFEIKLQKKDGSVMDCLLTSTVRLSPDNRILGYQGIIRDVTEFKRAEKALQESEARYRAVVEDQTEPICRLLPNRIITFVNQAYCRFFEKKYEQLVGHAFKLPMPEEDQTIAEGLFVSLSPENPVSTSEHRVIMPNGEIRWVQWTNRMVLDEHGHLIEFQSVGRDITKRKTIEEELKKSSEKIKLFAYSVSHDLKNPAIVLYGLTKHLKKCYGDALDDEGRHFCDQISKTSEQIFDLVEKINLFISTKESLLTIETVKLKEITQMVKEEFSPQFNIQQIAWEEPKDLPEIRADRISLLRALRNLVDNSLKYGGDELSKITIGYNDSPDFHTLFVKDDGVGLKKEASKNVFGWFTRFETSKGIEGTGLGLSIVKEIAERHGGTVWMEPGPIKGITFYLSIFKDL